MYYSRSYTKSYSPLKNFIKLKIKINGKPAFVAWPCKMFRGLRRRLWVEPAERLLTDPGVPAWVRAMCCWCKALGVCCHLCNFFASSFFKIIWVLFLLRRKNIASAPTRAMPRETLTIVSFIGLDSLLNFEIETSGGRVLFIVAKFLLSISILIRVNSQADDTWGCIEQGVLLLLPQDHQYTLLIYILYIYMDIIRYVYICVFLRNIIIFQSAKKEKNN